MHGCRETHNPKFQFDRTEAVNKGSLSMGRGAPHVRGCCYFRHPAGRARWLGVWAGLCVPVLDVQISLACVLCVLLFAYLVAWLFPVCFMGKVVKMRCFLESECGDDIPTCLKERGGRREAVQEKAEKGLLAEAKSGDRHLYKSPHAQAFRCRVEFTRKGEKN